MEVRDVNMDFSYGSAFAEDSPEAYERLILDMLLGEPSLFPTNAEVELVVGDPGSRAGLLGVAWQTLIPTNQAPGDRRRPTRCCTALAGNGGGRDCRPAEHDDQRHQQEKITGLREEGGAITLSRVLTLVISLHSDDLLEDSIEAANFASREHPCRVIVVVQGDRNAAEPRLDAQLRVGGGCRCGRGCGAALAR